MTALAIAASMTCLFVSCDGRTNDLAVTGWTATLDGSPCALKRGERHFVDHVFDGGWVFEGIDCLERHEAELSATFVAPETGIVVAGLTGDWFYDLSVDGTQVFSTGEAGNGTSELGFWNNTARFPVSKGVHRLLVRLRNGMGGMMFAIGKPGPAPVRSVNPIGIEDFRAAYRRLWARGDALSRNAPARLADLAAIQRGIDMTDGDDFCRFVETGGFDPAKSPALDMINAAIDRILAEVPTEKVAPGTVVAWYLYNMGFVVKTPGGTVFAVDLYAPRCTELAAICDFALVTHNHPDHAHLPFVAAMQAKGGFLRGKPVVSSFLYTRHFARSPKTFRFGDCTVETGVSDHNPHWKESVTPFRVTCGEGADAVTVVHAGDGWDGRQLARFAPADIAIVHVWPYDGHNGADTAAALKPGLLVLAHHQEMSHGFGIARFSFERTEREAARVRAAGSTVVPVWGEKIVWPARSGNGESRFALAKWIGPRAETRPEVDFGSARWISAQATNVFVRRFVLDAAPTNACELAFVARNEYCARLNGVPLAACYWEHAHDWSFVRTLDVAQWLKKGVNELSFAVKPFAGEPPALLARLDCGGVRIVTDGAWGDVAVGGTLREVEGGERIRSRAELATPAFERNFAVKGPVARATLAITGLGFYEARINGDKVGDKVLDPSFTDYSRRVLYSVYDVASMLHSGLTNTISIILGHGWYDHRSLAVWQFEAAPWRDFPRTIAQLDIEYADGSRETVATDGSWSQVTGEVAYDDIMEGEIIRREGAGRRLGFAAEVPAPRGSLVEALHPGTKVVRTMKPSSVRRLAPRRWLVAFPENVAGWMRMVLRRQPRGRIVSFTYDERLGENGLPPDDSPWREKSNIWNGQTADGIRRIDAYFVAPGSYRTLPGLTGALQRDRLVCSGAAGETYEPRFSYKGFRYVTIDGIDGDVSAEDIEGCVVSTDFKETGFFRCSDETFNRLVDAAGRSYRSNFVVAVPTDCPHREKNGWTGDAAAAVETAQYLYDNTAAYKKWLRDMVDAQKPSGELPGIVPTGGWGYFWGNGPGWDAALPVVAEAIYRHKADASALVETFPALSRLCDFYMREKANGMLVDWGLGDWCAPDESKIPSVEYTSSCHVMRAHEIAALAARLAGCQGEERRLCGIARCIREAIRRKFMRSPGVFDNGGQTAQGMAIEFGLVEPDELACAGDALVAAFAETGGHVAGGMFGMRHAFRALSRVGRADIAFRAITMPSAPSLVRILEDGGTTLWEDWNDRASRNHVMFCDFAGWAFAHLAGIRPASPGYGRVLLAPEPIDALDFVEASVATPHGRIASAWRREGSNLRFDFAVPEGTEADVRLPGGRRILSGPGVHSYLCTNGLPRMASP